VLTTSTGYQQLSAWVILRNKASERMRRFADEFGMSPYSRSRVTASENDGQMQLPGIDDGKQSGWGAI
jgi:phage terminase small subunit